MPHNLDLILTLTGGLTAALVLGLMTQKLRLSPIVGYLLAGIAVGPFTPGFVANKDLAVGWLVVEDIFTVIALVLLPALVDSTTGGMGSSHTVWSTLGIAIVKLIALVGFTFAIGGKLIPILLNYVARTHSRELFTLAVLVLALGIAVGASTFFGASMALGAFLAGMIVGQSAFSARAASDALPMRDAFAVLFFVSVGMLLEPSSILSGGPLMLVTLGIILIGKPLAALIVMLSFRRSMEMPATGKF